MARRRRYRKSSRDFALEHIEAGKKLSRELGGTDKDVKRWFFNLPNAQLNKILDAYQAKFGPKPGSYARQTFPKWKSGETQMSGLVAERLFSLLPNYMPLETKFNLVESLWKHVAPSKKRLIVAGREADIDEIVLTMEKEIIELTTGWTIPQEMESRFKWLANKDSRVYQQLLSRIKQQEKDLGEQILKAKVPALKSRFENDLRDMTSSISQTLVVGRQSLEIRFEGEHERIWCGGADNYRSRDGGAAGDNTWILWVIAAIGLLILAAA